MIKSISVLLVLVALEGCDGPSADTKMKISTPGRSVNQQDQRFEVERTGVFDDDLAYDNKRGIYIIHDKKTGKEYLGVSGVGISELGDHGTGDNQVVEDER